MDKPELTIFQKILDSIIGSFGPMLLALVLSVAVLWLNSRYVTVDTDRDAWKLQNSINIDSVKQFQETELLVRLNSKSYEELRARLDRLESKVLWQKNMNDK